MTRETRQGGVSNPAERLSPEQALRAVTIEAAWSLGLDDQIGSLEAGKLADFTILGADPLTTAAADWPGIEIVATMVGGKIHTVSASK
jgi:predicted amidohydrolase YtcJ